MLAARMRYWPLGVSLGSLKATCGVYQYRELHLQRRRVGEDVLTRPGNSVDSYCPTFLGNQRSGAGLAPSWNSKPKVYLERR